MKIRKYIKGINVTERPVPIQEIIRNQQQQASAYEENAGTMLLEAIANGRFYVAGRELELRGSNAKDKINAVLKALIENVYTKLGLVQEHCKEDMEIREILTKKDTQMHFEDISIPNAETVSEIEDYLTRKSILHSETTMGDLYKRFRGIPYGWREIDIASLIAFMIAAQKLMIIHFGEQIQPDDPRLPIFLSKKTEVDRTVVKRRKAVDPILLNQAHGILREYLDNMDVPTDEDGMIAYIRE